MDEPFETYRYLLFSIAYRMLGSVMEAEDMVQEAYLRYRATPLETINAPKAFLCTIITRLCLDHLKSARVQRETYIGPWLPEPVLTGGDDEFTLSPAAQVSAHESISMAFLVLLENLTPVERAVFLLREVFDYDYGEIAQIVDREESACRQLFSRAKKHISANRPRFEPTPEQHQAILTEFMHVVEAGDLDGIMNLLADDVAWWSDGGGKVKSATRPLQGRGRVHQFISGLIRLRPPETTHEQVEINGQGAIVVRVAGDLYAVFNIETDHQRVTRVRAVTNPDKLRHLKTMI
jgi:RNA polymerase sigma-70 factor (ECF subfamily)